MVKGVTGSVVASVLFAAMFYYVTLMNPLTGDEIFGWRMLFNAPGLTAIMFVNRDWPRVRHLLRRIWQSPILALGVVVCACLVAAQLWVFVWAPVNGQAMEASLGFFLMPLFLVLIGRVIFNERLSRVQLAATLCAIVGVTNELIRVGGLSWVTLLIAIGYPTYFVLRRKLGTDHQGGVWIEMHLIVPLAIVLIVSGPDSLGTLASNPDLILLIPGLGLISAVALSGYYLANQLLPFGVFGLLAYLEPVLLVFVALLLGEGIEQDQWLTYIPIWCAVVLLFAEGVYRVAPRNGSAMGSLSARRRSRVP